jgi:hypothetical protein
MVGEPFDLVGQALRVEPFDGLHDAAVEGTPPFLQQAPIGHLMGEGMFEGVLEVGEDGCLVEELAGLQVREAQAERLLRLLRDGLQQDQGHLRADDGSRLK